MAMRGSARKECGEHERRWRDLCVDESLADEWLERLNDLGAFTLVGICEGHSDQRPGSSRRYPHINLRLKKSLLPGLARHWEELRMAILNEVGKLFESGDTDVQLELKFRLRAGRGRLLYQEDLTLRMRNYQARNTQEMGEELRNWFEKSIERIEGIDRVVTAWHAEHVGS